MFKSARRSVAALMAAIMLAQPVLAAEYFVVVPVPGRTGPVGVSVALNPAALPDGLVGQAYSGFDFTSALQVKGDTSFNGGGVSWSATGVPSGLAVSSSGVLEGLPLQASSGPIRVTAAYKGIAQPQDYTLNVLADSGVLVESVPEALMVSGSEKIVDGQAELTVAPTSVAFGSTARLLDSTPVTVTVSNTGTAPAPLTVAVPSVIQFKQTNNCPAVLAVGAACQVQVVANPTSTSKVTGSFAVNLGVKTSTVTLSATGQNAGVSLTHTPALAGYYQQFGVVAVGQFATAQTVLKNTSKYYALAVSGASIINSATASFSATHNCPAALAPGQTCAVTSKYAPTDGNSHSGTARIAMNISGNSRDVYLRGRGAGALAVSSLSHAGASLAGGGSLVITGAGFLPGAQVFFGETAAATTYTSTTSVSATVPAVAAAEQTWVKVVNPDGSSATAPVTFNRALAFAAFTTPALDFGNQAVGLASPYKTAAFANAGYATPDTFVISNIQVSGPFSLYSSGSYCTVGQTLSRLGSCNVRARYTATAAGAQTGAVTISGNGTSIVLPLMGSGSAWDAVPSGSVTANTPIDAEVVLSGNEHLGGASQTQLLDIFLRNAGAGQLTASFKLENGTAAKISMVYKTNTSASAATTNCAITNGVQTAVCLADGATGARPHLQIRLNYSSVVGLGTFSDALIISDSSGNEQYRIPLILNVVNNATTEMSSTYSSTIPLDAAGLAYAGTSLSVETYKDVYIRNVGTNGMLLARSVKLTGSPEFYMKSGISLYTINNTGSYSGCSTFINSTELGNCLMDDVNGGFQPHARVRVYFNPLTAGSYAATLAIDQSGVGVNPIQIPVTAGVAGTTQVFSGGVANAVVSPLATLTVPENFSVDGTNSSEDLQVHLNKTSGSGLMAGYFSLDGAVANKLSLVTPLSVSAAGATGFSCTGTSEASSLCSTTTAYPHLRATIRAYASWGEGTYTTTLRFMDPSMKEMVTTPITIRVVNDATALLSSSTTATVPYANNTVDMGSATLATAPGQVSATVSKSIYVRNTGLYGKLKISRATIEGGSGAFTFAAAPLQKAYGSAATSCTATRVSALEAIDCLAYDPSASTTYNHISANIEFTPTVAGAQSATLKLWHNSKTAPNPLVVTLNGTSQQVLVAGEASSTYASTVAPTGSFGNLASTTAYKDIFVYFRNTGLYGALYSEDISVSGDAAFQIAGAYRLSIGNSATACGTVVAGDKRSASPCLSDSPDGGNYFNQRVTVRCAPVGAGSVTGQLRVKMQGKEHLLPLTCSKS